MRIVWALLLTTIFPRSCQESWCLFVAGLSLNSSGRTSSNTVVNPTMTDTAEYTNAETLRTWVQQAAVHDEINGELDLTGIVWLEHVNLVVGSKQQAQAFYLDLLGCSADRSPSFHVNLGNQQFHLAETGDPAQRVTGSLGLVVPCLDTLRQRVAALQDTFANTQFQVWHDEGGDCMTLTCPWGNRLHLYDLQAEQAALVPTSDSPHKMIKMHAEGGNYAAHRMAVRGQPGIRFIELACPLGTAAPIAAFYRDMMHCIVSEPEARRAVVGVGPGVHLVYREDETLSETDIQAMQGVHICIYVEGFKALYERLQAKNLVWTNPRFTHLDSCDTWEQAQASRTLRFKDIIDLSTGEKIFELEHETRPMRHGQYLKVPFYEPK